MANTATEDFRKARDFLIERREDYEAAYRGFRWPKLVEFNWALNWFDVIAKGNRRPALQVFSDHGGPVASTFAELSEISSRVANALKRLGVKRGDRILVMLGNQAELWQIILAAMKVGAVIVPATSQLTTGDLEDRFARGAIKHVVADASCTEKFAAIAGSYTRIAVGLAENSWQAFETLYASDASFLPDGPTKAGDPMLLYFTSGTTAKPKLVLHTHQSYPVGHLSTMYWIGCRPGDVHFNISSPGWAKHAWSSFFAPWNAESTVVALDYRRFVPSRALAIMRDADVSTLCAPPTVWRLIVLDPLGERPHSLREIVSAGEPLNPEVIEKVRAAWGITIRDGYGQTETTAQIGNSPGQSVSPGAMGRPLPGYRATLLSSDGKESNEGEIALFLAPEPPVGLMAGYLEDTERTQKATAGGFYRTGDEARRDESGHFFYIARADDVFKSSDYRISPFELESALLEHSGVAEAAVVASPDPLRFAVPKAFVVLKPGVPSTKETAESIFVFLNQRLAPYKRIRLIEFSDLPKTISGKIRRVELRRREEERSRGLHVSGPTVYSDRVLKATYAEPDFDKLSWHDCRIWGLEFHSGDSDEDDWTSDLILDIDFITEWVCGIEPGSTKFRVAPATLAFHGVTDLKINIESDHIGYQVALSEVSIDRISREQIQNQKVFFDRPYYKWTVRLNSPKQGEIVFGAVGFTQTLRAEPLLTDKQCLSLQRRKRL